MPSGCHDRSRRVTKPLCTLSEHHALLFIIKTERPREPYSEQLLEKSMANKKRACGHSVKFKLTNCSFSLFFFWTLPQYGRVKPDKTQSPVVRVMPCSQAHFTELSTWENILSIMQLEHSQLSIHKPQVERVRLGLQEKKREKRERLGERKWSEERRESSYISDAHFQTPFPIYSWRVKVSSGRKEKAKSMGCGMERQKGQKRNLERKRENSELMQ